MKKYTELRGRIQVKLCQFIKKLSFGFSRPEQKFLHDILFGLLKGSSSFLSGIARELGEGISVKKVVERLNRHLRKSGLGSSLMENYVSLQSTQFRDCQYFSLDLSDISKRYAQKMEGLGMVWDGSEQSKGLGYWQVNVVGVDRHKSVVIPAYSETFSLMGKDDSENKHIKYAMDAVESVCSGKIWVIDRGGDRGIIFKHLLRGFSKTCKFIVRMNKTRDLIDEKGTKQRIWRIVQDTKLPYSFQIKHKSKLVTVLGGLRQVKLPGYEDDLYLVTFKYKGWDGGWFYFLFNLEGEDEAKLVEGVLHGYGLRWIVEEVHRQIKQDFNLEGIRVHYYEGIRNLCALIWIAAGFYYSRLGPTLEHPEVLFEVIGVTYRRRYDEVLGFVYYKLKRLVAKLLEPAVLKKRIFYPKPSLQLAMKFIC